MTNDGEFTSKGFDLDAAGAASDGDDVVYEIGGGATITSTSPKVEERSSPSGDNSDKPNDAQQDSNTTEGEVGSKEEPKTLLEKAEDWKQQGNVQFKQGNYLEAIDLYTEAINVCPCPVKGPAILELQKQHDKAEHERRMKIFRQAEIDRENERKSKYEKEKQKKGDDKTSESESSNSNEQPKKNNDDVVDDDDGKPKPYVLPPQLNGDKLSIFYNNRAAAYYQLKDYGNSIEDCNVAILLNPKYTKGYVRRSMAYEKLPTTTGGGSDDTGTFGQSSTHTENALNDMKIAQMLEPKNPTINKNVKRLQKLEDERLEKLKTETMGT